jgi:methanogenic corrinoid protein MtbC1
MFGISVARRGRRVVFLGADTPLETLREAVAAMRPSAVVLAVTRPDAVLDASGTLTELAADAPLLICGPGAEPDVVAAIGAEVLSGDPVTAADTLTR